MLEAPSLYDEFLRHLARRGYPVPADCVERDWSRAAPPHARTCSRCSRRSTTSPERDWEAYEMCEELVDVEESFQLWRFRHMKTVERIIGYKRGTGGSSGVGFLRAALDLTFFPELLDVRTRNRLTAQAGSACRRSASSTDWSDGGPNRRYPTLTALNGTGSRRHRTSSASSASRLRALADLTGTATATRRAPSRLARRTAAVIVAPVASPSSTMIAKPATEVRCRPVPVVPVEQQA